MYDDADTLDAEIAGMCQLWFQFRILFKCLNETRVCILSDLFIVNLTEHFAI